MSQRLVQCTTGYMSFHGPSVTLVVTLTEHIPSSRRLPWKVSPTTTRIVNGGEQFMNTLCVGFRPYLKRLAMAVALVVFALVVTPALSGQAFLPASNFITGGGPAAVAVGDFNADGRPDFVVANSVDGTVSVLLNNGDGTFGPAVNYPVGTNSGSTPTAVAVADLNGDGRPDIIT